MIRSGDDGQHKYYKVTNHTYIDTYTHILPYIHENIEDYSELAIVGECKNTCQLKSLTVKGVWRRRKTKGSEDERR